MQPLAVKLGILRVGIICIFGIIHTRQKGGMVINRVDLPAGDLVFFTTLTIYVVAFGLVSGFGVEIWTCQQRRFAILDTVQVAVQGKCVIRVRVIQVSACSGADWNISE